MNQNTNSSKIATGPLFILEVRIPDQSPKRLEVIDRILAGLDPRNDLILIDPKIKAKHFLFSKKNNILMVHYMGGDGETFLNGLPLEKGKLYVLENGDVLNVGKIEIMVRSETGISRHSSPTFVKKQEPAPLIEVDNFLDEIMAKKNIPATESLEMIPAKIGKPHFDFKAFALIPYKFYGFMIDVALTYLVLGFVLPALGVLSDVQDIFFPLSEYVSQYITNKYPEFPIARTLSLIDFFICFHCLVIANSLILGTTPGAFIIGLHYKGKGNFITIRFKAYIYALLNTALLPLLLFDIPLYQGKTIKELLTFSAREINPSILFKFLRKAVAPLFIIASFLSPFFLSPPYNANIAQEKLASLKYKDAHTSAISSYSREFGFSLRTELNKNFVILPSFTKGKLGLVIYDFKNKKSLIMSELSRTNNTQALFKVRYSNPLSSLMIQEGQIENEFLKKIALQSLELSLANIAAGLFEFGPFLANRFLFKEEFLAKFLVFDNFIYNPFEEKNPALKISAGNEERVFLFTRKDVIAFSVVAPKQTNLLEHFVNSILVPLRFDQSSNDGLKDPQVLEVLEAFERSNYQTILTYYINEAKKSQVLQNPEWKAFLKINLEQTKRALFEDLARVGLTKNIEKSFDDIVSTL